MLPHLLRSFALRVAFAEQTTDGRALGVFTRQYRDRITESLQQTLQSRQHDSGAQADEPNSADNSPEMTFHDKIRLWSLEDPTDSEARDDESIISERRISIDDSPETNFHEKVGLWSLAESTDGGNINKCKERDEEGPEDNEVDNPEYVLSEADMARINFAVNTSSFSWLPKAVQSRSQLTYNTADTVDSIRNLLSSCLNQYRGNRALRSQKAVIRMAWDPRLFTEQQGYEGSHSLFTALAISGSSTKAQLLSCEEFLKQTWPLTGETVMEALVEVAGLDTGWVCAECTGLFDSIVEVAEVLAWTGSALRESSTARKVMHSVAGLRVDEKTARQDSSMQFLLTFTEEELPTADVPGDCWLHGFLNNPVIAKGFPISKRPEDAPGLEIPLQAMALLVDALQLTVFNSRALLKGFNTAVVPTDYAGRFIKWHFILNDDGKRLPYSDKRISESPQIGILEAMTRIQHGRHILGWATHAAYNIGSPDANYDIGWSSPDFVGPGCALEKFVISGGPGFISGGAEFSLGRKDKAPTIKRHTSYFESLRPLYAKTKRGILVMSVSLTSRPLRRTANLELPVFPALDEIRTEKAIVHGPSGQTTTTHYRETTTVRLKDRVCQIMEGKLEGYRFMEVATRRSITPRVVHLRAFEGAGKSWVDFIRAIRAVTLFGEGFGELIAPRADNMDTNTNQTVDGPALCNRWKALPKNRDYLAASGHDLSRILRQEGNARSNPLKLALGILWNQPTTAFERCACAGHGKNKNLNLSKGNDAFLRAAALLRRPCDRVQILLPSSSHLTSSILSRSGISSSSSSSSSWISDPDMAATRAVIFGRSGLFPWR
ncbi:hypothetical protein B0T14DRAFT_601131 [Immersiella caudata]|uniref:Uncharacterized protein n=1 Tax=Immersiella caudata TaxID=314043 RepID=A0AA39WVI0_9PEZI|nr:hypothetical protein B0T14DRAFT_601131 [Immersiella caudata]